MNQAENTVNIVLNNIIFTKNTYQPCPYCFGTGKLKAMQGVCLYNGESVRSNDVLIKCKYCDGTGVKYE